MKLHLRCWVIILLAASAWMTGCKSTVETAALPTLLFPADTRTAAPATETATLTAVPQTPTAGQALPTVQASPSFTPQASATVAIATPAGAYPFPPEPATVFTSTPAGAYPFPLPQQAVGTETSMPNGANPYPFPQQPVTQSQPTSEEAEAYPFPQQPGLSSPTPLAGTPTVPPLANPTVSTPTGPAPTERFPLPFGLKVTPAAGKVSIFHSWTNEDLAVLRQVIDSFQDYFPYVVFDLTYIPQADLLNRYTQNAYYGAGPDILFGSSDWRASLASQTLVEDLAPYISDTFQKTFNPVALKTGEYRGVQACLPYALRGAVLYRNQQIVPQAPSTFSQLVSSARQATKAGTLGAYFEGGGYFSLAHLSGLGGQLLDGAGMPLFDRDQYKHALAWLGLLGEMKRLGAVELNGDRDRQLFEQGKAGWIVEGTWNRAALSQSIGSDNLAIDPWPAYGTGKLSGFVQSDCLYLNINTGEISSLDHQAALNFIGYFMTTVVQVRLAELGLIPALIQAQPTDPLIRQAMLAFQGGTAYPAELDDALRQVYFTAMDEAVDGVLNRGQDPFLALRTASAAIQKRVAELRGGNQ